MAVMSAKSVYHNLRLLERVDVAEGAVYRQMAQEILADTSVSLLLRMAIANRLFQANHRLEMATVGGDDSY